MCSLSWKFGINYLVSMRHLLSMFMCDLNLTKRRLKSSSNGFLIDIPLLVEYLSSGQNRITCMIYTNGKYVK